jgi:hypothetical protein
MENIRFIHQELNGKRIAYTNQTRFVVQVGRNRKAGYQTRYVVTGNLAQAVGWYNGINIGNGYKKRLICHELNKPVLARQFSY